MSQVKYKHFFVVKNGQFVFENKEMLNAVKQMLEGKRGFAIIEEEIKGPTIDQYAYYFGGIIRKECMNSEAFAGLSEKEVHSALMYEVGATITVSYLHPRKGRIIKEEPEDIKRWSVKRMIDHIDKVIAHLNIEYRIYPKPPEHYKDNKYYMDPKTIKK